MKMLICQIQSTHHYLRSKRGLLDIKIQVKMHYLIMQKLEQNDFQLQYICCISTSCTGHIFWTGTEDFRRQTTTRRWQGVSLLTPKEQCQFQSIFRIAIYKVSSCHKYWYSITKIISENIWRQESTLCILKVLEIVFGISQRAEESHVLDYKVINPK